MDLKAFGIVFVAVVVVVDLSWMLIFRLVRVADCKLLCKFYHEKTTGTCLTDQLPRSYLSTFVSFASVWDVKQDKKWKMDWSQIVTRLVGKYTRQDWRLFRFVCYLITLRSVEHMQREIRRRSTDDVMLWLMFMFFGIGLEGCGVAEMKLLESTSL